MYYYYRVAEELVFVLPSRCANSLKRTPPSPHPPPQKKNVSLKNGPTIPFLLLWPTTTPPSVYLDSCGEICPRPFLMISVVWKKENGLREEIKLNLTRNQILHSSIGCSADTKFNRVSEIASVIKHAK